MFFIVLISCFHHELAPPPTKPKEADVLRAARAHATTWVPLMVPVWGPLQFAPSLCM